jgi:hypothetical protein
LGLHYEIAGHESGDFYPFFFPPPSLHFWRLKPPESLLKETLAVLSYYYYQTLSFFKSVKSTVEFTEVGIRYHLQIDVQFLVPHLKLGCCQSSGFSNRSDFGVRSVQSCVLEALHYFFNNGEPGGRERERERKGGDANPGKQAGVKGLKVSLDSQNLIWKISQLLPQLL